MRIANSAWPALQPAAAPRLVVQTTSESAPAEDTTAPSYAGRAELRAAIVLADPNPVPPTDRSFVERAVAAYVAALADGEHPSAAETNRRVDSQLAIAESFMFDSLFSSFLASAISGRIAR